MAPTSLSIGCLMALFFSLRSFAAHLFYTLILFDVRNVREWVQMASEHRGVQRRREDQLPRLNSPVGQSRDAVVAEHEDGHAEHTRRDMLRLRGRQALIDLLVRLESERQSELQGLLEHRAVSDFAHRNRIQDYDSREGDG